MEAMDQSKEKKPMGMGNQKEQKKKQEMCDTIFTLE